MIKLTITTKGGTTVSLDIPDSEEVIFEQAVERAVEQVQVSEPVREEVVASTSVDEVLAQAEEQQQEPEPVPEDEPNPFDYYATIDTSLDSFQFPCADKSMYCPPMPLVRDFILAFGEEHVRREFLKARSWLLANPEKRKTQRGMSRYLNAWLCRQAGMERAPIKSIAPKTDSLLSNGNTKSDGW
ncbi:hypothetical protein UFOVP917_37 [uncultured Caudovirales phage]|uniref:Uncharacterized protein n=1 Tax=uncultured Caudovirales phage TaxID=2100421 RepID=A0A6J5RT05_9CAUD|nr:hypothetical protein UFOVP297_15 [uncultured Caudovirales phage]CAB4171301.1 hypothetical protein UFOVP917_37 [uncultured Caudovirales phage]CAB4183074.1 hypothetical protein UFOVP1094_39 [uncultured Caudovirales phage]CAB4200467.1 hypothetical protein UFOVP1342_39 [uncultured Caudovirales phage]CAB4213433.1 hypothetical protein UFOVP1450_19 [uncultured Caudovirales phage]